MQAIKCTTGFIIRNCFDCKHLSKDSQIIAMRLKLQCNLDGVQALKSEFICNMLTKKTRDKYVDWRSNEKAVNADDSGHNCKFLAEEYTVDAMRVKLNGNYDSCEKVLKDFSVANLEGLQIIRMAMV